MSVTELQKKLIEKISNTNDIETLEEISRWIGLNEETSFPYRFSEDQLNKLEEAEHQIKNGDFKTDEDVNKETQEWLKK